MYHDKATPWLRRGVSDQGRKATSVETSRITPICIHLFTHLSILHSFIQLTNLSGCIFVLIFWLVCLVRLEFIFLQKLQFSYWSAILLHWTTYFLPETLEELYMDSGHWAGRKQCKCFPSATICAACQGLYWPHLLSMICAQRAYAKDHQTRDHRVHSITMRAHSYILVEWASLFTCEWTLCCIPWGPEG